jgi:crotonobetainyl-CoA:carnitine CoA-transferase CaiB-like acyl-CoA transferase
VILRTNTEIAAAVCHGQLSVEEACKRYALLVGIQQYDHQKLREPAPLLGQHTDEVLRELGYDAAEIASLVERKIVACA